MDPSYRCIHNYLRTDPSARRCPNRAAPGSVYCPEHRAGHLAQMQAVPPKKYKIEPLHLPGKAVRHSL